MSLATTVEYRNCNKCVWTYDQPSDTSCEHCWRVGQSNSVVCVHRCTFVRVHWCNRDVYLV